MIQCIAEGEPSITRENQVLEIRGTYKVTKKTSLFFLLYYSSKRTKLISYKGCNYEVIHTASIRSKRRLKTQFDGDTTRSKY